MWPPGNSVTILKVNSINFIIKIYCRNKKLLNMISIKIKQISPGQRCFSVDFFCKGLWSGMNFLKAHTIIFRTKNRYSMENRNEMSNNTFDYRSNKTIVCAQLFFSFLLLYRESSWAYLVIQKHFSIIIFYHSITHKKVLYQFGRKKKKLSIFDRGFGGDWLVL